MLKKTPFFWFIGALFSSLPPLYSQCAMCKAVVETGEVSLAEGINNGITYLMVFPYLLVGTLFYFVYKHRKKAKN